MYLSETAMFARSTSHPCAICGVLWLLIGCETPPHAWTQEDVRDVPSHFPAMPAEEDNALNEAKWELGRHLFFDERLSDDGAVSCASCHIPSHAFAQNLAVPEGSDGVAGTRNAPALMNMAWQPAFHREGGIHSLEAQVLAPIQEPTEFNRDVVELVDALALDPQYQHWSEQAFERPFDAYVLTRSIAAFERTLVSGTSMYDAWLQGDENALSDAELRGLELFESLECMGCHSGVFLTDFQSHNTGLYAEYQDPGAYRLTLDSLDFGAFKTPSLRNVAETAPYMFDGSMPTLEDVIDHYASGGANHVNQDPRVRPRTISSQDKADLIAFLRALSDPSFVTWAAQLEP